MSDAKTFFRRLQVLIQQEDQFEDMPPLSHYQVKIPFLRTERDSALRTLAMLEQELHASPLDKASMKLEDDTKWARSRLECLDRALLDTELSYDLLRQEEKFGELMAALDFRPNPFWSSAVSGAVLSISAH